jgi:hypothetical protein
MAPTLKRGATRPFNTLLEADCGRKTRRSAAAFLSLAFAYISRRQTSKLVSLSRCRIRKGSSDARPVQRRQVSAVCHWSIEQSSVASEAASGVSRRVYGKTLHKMSRGTSIKPVISDRSFCVRKIDCYSPRVVAFSVTVTEGLGRETRSFLPSSQHNRSNDGQPGARVTSGRRAPVTTLARWWGAAIT